MEEDHVEEKHESGGESGDYRTSLVDLFSS